MIAPWVFGRGLHALDIGANLGAGPVLRAYEFAANDTISVDQVALGEDIASIALVAHLVAISDGEQVNVVVDEELVIDGGVFVGAHGEHNQLRHLMMQIDERRKLYEARRAPCCPEVEQDDLSSVSAKLHRLGVVANYEVGRRDPDLGGVDSPVAPRDPEG